MSEPTASDHRAAWSDIEQLGAIAFIRTFPNFFLERDLEKYTEPASASPVPEIPGAVAP